MPGGLHSSGSGEGALLFLIIPLMIIVVVVVRMMAGGMDHDRIRQYIEQQGGRVLDANWSPMGPGWAGEKSDRIYRLRYLDRDGNEHEAHCKTSMWSGVYLSDDRIVKRAEPREAPPTSTDLAEENRRLREEVERLRRQQRNE